MKKLLIVLASGALFYTVFAQSITYNYSRALTADEARGIRHVVWDFIGRTNPPPTGAQLKAYMDTRVDELFEGYNKVRDEVDNATLKALWEAANATKRTNALNALQ